MKTYKVLKPIKTKNFSIKDNFFVFDTETTKLEPMPKNFVFGVIYGYNYIKVIKSVRSFKREFEKPMYRNKYVFAHNAEFDLLTVFGNIYKNLDSKAIFNGKFITAKMNKITFADSMNIYPTSVKKIGEMVGSEKFENEKIKGQGLTKENITEQDIEYCIRDCKIVWDALLQIFESIGTIKFTLASLSFYNYRNKFLNKSTVYSDLNNEFFNSYYGGRTEVFKLGQCSGKVYDINSLYPFVMSDMNFPNLTSLRKVSKCDIKFLHYLLKCHEGLANIIVKHKETYFGFLPFKVDRLFFPVGTFETTVNFNELRFALEHEAIEILKVNHVIYSEPVKTPFKDFIDYHYNERLETNNKLKQVIHKLIMNSLYGRFAMRTKYKTEYFENIPCDLIANLQKDEKFYLLKIFNEIRQDCYLITKNSNSEHSFFSIPTYSSYITSQARIILLKSLIENEYNKVLYCDTDSIFLEGDFSGIINNELGNFKQEEKRIIDIKGLKNYIMVNETGIHEIIKGVSKNAKKIDNNVYEILRYYKTRESLRLNKEAGESHTLYKILKNDYHKRIILDNGQTEPVSIRLQN